jgi:hypothetical protein
MAHVNRYLVVDTWENAGASTVGGCTGRQLDSFHSLDSAKALALQRMAYGNVGVVVVDQVGGETVFPRPETDEDEPEPDSESRLRRAGSGMTRAIHTKRPA